MTIVKCININYYKYIDLVVIRLISYEPFWETLKQKKVSTYVLIKKYNISSATIDRMKKGNGISTTKINDFCKILKCNVSDIIKYVPEEDDDL